ncbi:gamma-glutamyl-gamma-aminobutyrate hydrolase family protein [Thermophilibacter provencensis]|uniref:Gamma-glutamyl-gamma-aminobutyrate hydrolase family protein n=1 Tax=Thermophilibacter provencensis TaxID=1852386 RepID=A0ABT7V7G1_9ACTN|nr:gamma-glutamyl-gamma-aminobutyrate hydrolase family protein [Thermophilibacter provencensis]MDM8271956.1 gamma-glutamyl-gamma-aminobutyrate hydrolase family protein [Thermophilibacter provencensis]
MSRKPLIGVVPLVDYGRESLWMLPGYFDAVLEARGVPVMLPLTTDAASVARLLGAVDGLVVTGGQDVDPARYGEKDPAAVGLCGELCPERDALEALLVPAALEADLPLLGICRGLQALNVILGGTLWQDLPKQTHSEVNHHGTAPYENPVHTVSVLPGTPLAACVGEGELPVNSFHHQALRDVAPGLKVMAQAADGVVEAVWRPASRFCWAVQWHPEFSHAVDGASRNIFSAFVGACRG